MENTILIIVIGCVIIGAIALPTLYITSRRNKGSLQSIYDKLGIQRSGKEIWNKSDFNDTLISSDTYDFNLEILPAFTEDQLKKKKKYWFSNIGGKVLSDYSINTKVNEVEWTVTICSVKNSGKKSAFFAYTGYTDGYVVLKCRVANIEDPEPLLPKILCCFAKKQPG